MSPMLQALRDALAQLREQLQASMLLRVGLGLAAALLLLEGVLRLMDQGDAWTAEARQLRLQVHANAVEGTASQWQERAAQAKLALAAWEQLQWSGDDPGLLESQLQDRLRDMAAKARLNVRDMAVMRNPTAADDGAIRLRMQIEFNRPGLLSLLTELEGLGTPLAVDRMHIRLNSQPQVVELELRAERARPTKEST